MTKLFSFLILLLIFTTNTSAVQLSKNGLGDVLLFPYYTVNNDFNSLISLTNTTSETKAYRVRFREAANAREVFAFNLYLGPNDMWTGALIKVEEQGLYQTKLITSDRSCTNPILTTASNLFSPNLYKGQNVDIYADNINRMHEGFIEVIEMGVLTGESAIATLIDGNSGIPNNCQKLVDAWDSNAVDNYWVNNNNTDISKPTGGLTGNVILINVAEGIAVSQEATAINDFSDTSLNFSPTNSSPNLSDGMIEAVMLDNQGLPEVTQWQSGYKAISAILTKESISNEFVLSDEIGAQTDWVITLPTRQFFTDYSLNGRIIRRPFTDRKCEPIGNAYYNRESQFLNLQTSPRVGIRPPSPANNFLLCYASNIIHFDDKEISEQSELGMFSSNYLLHRGYVGRNHDIVATGFPTYKTIEQGATATTPVVEATFFDTGWLNFSFDESISRPASPTNYILRGLPVIGFSVQKYINSNLGDSILANYTGIFNHIGNAKPQHSQQQVQESKPMVIADDNTGQVLIYPYYTVNNDFNTLLSISNPSSETKALKVRFLEGKNGRDCFDFNLYLGAHDMWTGALIPIQEPGTYIPNHIGEQSVSLLSNDHSCANPSIFRYPDFGFLPYGYDPGNDANPINGYDQLGLDLQRCREGYIEVIEMGVVSNSELIDRNGNVDCSSISNEDLSAPTGGLFGSASLIHIQNGIDMSYDATAIKHFSSDANLPPDNFKLLDSTPNLSTGTNKETLIETSDGFIRTQWSSSIDAVSALFMQSKIINDYVINPGIGAQTDWVTTYPTKPFYTDPMFVSNPPIAPFNHSIVADVGACDSLKFHSYNREQKRNGEFGVIADPIPPGNSPQHCFGVNVSYGENLYAGNLDRSKSLFHSNLLTSYWLGLNEDYSIYNLHSTEGNMQFIFDDGQNRLDGNWIEGVGDNGEIHRMYGKPVLGFVAQKYVNGAMNDGATLANYSFISKNKSIQKIEIIEN